MLADYGPSLAPTQPHDMPNEDHFQNVRVMIDPRVLAEVERKKPIGVNRTKVAYLGQSWPALLWVGSVLKQ